MNLFEITNFADLQLTYRLLRIDGLPQSEFYPKQVNLLAKSVAYEIQNPVSLLHRNGSDYLAIPDSARDPAPVKQLTPHVATLIPEHELYTLRLEEEAPEARAIALSFLRFAFQGPLMHNASLWGRGRAYYAKTAIHANAAGATVDVYPGFSWNLVPTGDGKIFLAVDVTKRYVERAWFIERSEHEEPNDFLRRQFLYHFGHKWYPVQLWGVTGRSIARQYFVPNGQGTPVDVYTYTQRACHENVPPWVRNLDPDSPAIVYRYSGNEQERYGALALCKLSLATSDPAVGRLHRHSIQEPAQRLAEIASIVGRHFQRVTLNGQPVQIAASPLEIERRIYPVPAQRFGHDRILTVGRNHTADNTTDVPLHNLGRTRLQLLTDPDAGPLDTTAFDAQYILQPRSAPRPVNDEFHKRFVDAMRELSAQPTYAVRRVLYDDAQARSLSQQIKAIQQALKTNGVSRGYVLLVLPEDAPADLHHYIKRSLWPDLQIQCANAGKIKRHFQTGKQGQLQVAKEQESRFASYVRNCALAMRVVNRKWSWALESALCHDLYIGIDVLNGLAGITIIYDNGRHIVFQDYPSQQKERLSARQIRTILVEQLTPALQTLEKAPKSIVVHRDGRTSPSELRGLHAAIHDLTVGGLLSPDVKVGVVEIRKTMADNLRIFEGTSVDSVDNPVVGAHRVLTDREGLVCTTGLPFRFPGTAKPLSAVVVEGELSLESILQDIFSLSHLAFTAPDKCMRLPATIKFADDFLEPIAAKVDEEEALYGEEISDILEMEEV